MKVAYDSRPAKESHGIGRYAGCLLEGLRQAGRPIVESRDPRDGDVFHSPWLEGAPLRSPVPTVVTLHDLIPLKRPGDYLRTGLRFKLRYLAVQRAARVIVPTKTVADDAIGALGIPAERISVIPEAAAAVFFRRPDVEVDAVRRRYDLPDRYLLWVGAMRTPDPRKRVAALARTSRSLPLVLVGPVSRWARELPDVQLTGAVSDDELAAIYTGAHALVFPSDEEGFGLPPVEALACGTPVAACDVPALREVLAGLVTLSAVEDLDALVRQAEALSRPAPVLPAWTWDDVAAATWEVYEQALSAPIRTRGARTPRAPRPALSPRGHGSDHGGGRNPNGGDRKRRA
jgi:glycosyltransferase involved in cell wall biosynthesis